MSVEAVASIAKWAPVIKQGYDWLFKKGGHSKKPSVPGYNPSVWENSYIKNLQQQANTGLTGQQQQMMMMEKGANIADKGAGAMKKAGLVQDPDKQPAKEGVPA